MPGSPSPMTDSDPSECRPETYIATDVREGDQMNVMIILLLAVSLVLPLFYTVRVMRLAEHSKIGWLIVAADATFFVALIFVLSRWDIAGYYTRYILLGLFVAALIRSIRLHRARPWWPERDGLKSHRSTMASLVFLSAAMLYVLSGTLSPRNTMALSFPLEGGRFVAVQAGGVSLLNYHANHPEQGHAVDVTAISPLGFRAGGLFPRGLESYVIFGASVVSPCDGTVTAARSDLPDLVPPQSDRENPSGNHVILSCGALDVELAHFQQGSVAVDVGDVVAAGALLGQVGNSGNTTEPHLHIHAVDLSTGLGVPISFDGRYPVRNGLFRR